MEEANTRYSGGYENESGYPVGFISGRIFLLAGEGVSSRGPAPCVRIELLLYAYERSIENNADRRKNDEKRTRESDLIRTDRSSR